MHKFIFLLISAIFAVTTMGADYSAYEKLELYSTKYNWLCNYADEKNGNRGGKTDAYKFNQSHFLLLDWDLTNIPAYDKIKGVELTMVTTAPAFGGIMGVMYNCIRSDVDWITGTGTSLVVTPPNGEANFNYAQVPSTPWASGVADFLELVMGGADMIPILADNYVAAQGMIVLDLKKDVLKDFLEGNAHGITLWGGSCTASEDCRVTGGVGLFFLRIYHGDGAGIVYPGTDKQNNPVKVFPNPVYKAATFSLPGKGIKNTRVTILSLDGKLVRNLTPGADSFLWDGTNNNGNPVKSGLYIYNVINDKEVYKTGRVLFAK
ncbi:MAG: FlgD immunoglobulin-like domain containing protein [bacterium]